MSFKSKQRAKHGLLFGDDPLNATLLSASDDPLFSPSSSSTSKKAQSQSSRTNSPTFPNDPLSRPTDTSSSTPLSPRRNIKSSSPSSGSSIFGDIDVSKLGTSNGKKYTVRSPALRSKQYDLEDEEDLFGGGHRTRKISKVTTAPSSSLSSSIHEDITPVNKKSNASTVPVSLPSPIIQSQQQTPLSSPSLPSLQSPPPQQPQKEQPTKSETIPPVAKKEEKPTMSSSSSSFFRFFKSTNNSNTNSKNSSSASSTASSTASVNASSPIVKNNDAVNNTTTLPPIPPIRQQSQPSSLLSTPAQQQSAKPTYSVNSTTIPQEEEVEEEEEEELEEEQLPIIEDEATRAFAEDNVITFKPTLLNYRSISPELTMDALKIDTTTNTTTITTSTTSTAAHKKLVPSVSTPTHNVDDPWSNPLLTQPIIVEPSMSSPLAVKVQDIEPQKRTAFADLINSWNTGKSNNKEYLAHHDPREFFDHVAEERRDIGFAGIREHVDNDDEEEEGHYHSRQLDYQDEINPWN